MKTRIYLRVAQQQKGRKPPRVNATMKPSHAPLTDNAGVTLPTVAFAIDFDLPDSMFRQAEQVIAEITVPKSSVEIAADVRVVEP